MQTDTQQLQYNMLNGIQNNTIQQPPSLIGLATQSKYQPVTDYTDEKQKEFVTKVKDRNKGEIIRSVIFGTLYFIILSQPVIYKISNKIVQVIMSSPINIIDADNCATRSGIFVHAAIFFIVLLFTVF
jgi:hypothetical protein